MLENIFNFYKTESENDIQNISQLIEPVLILLLGLGVGVLVAAVLLRYTAWLVLAKCRLLRSPKPCAKEAAKDCA